MQSIIKDLERAINYAENHQSADKAMEYAYKYGVLLGSIKMAIIELSTTKSIKP
jgi:hypothetical protein